MTSRAGNPDTSEMSSTNPPAHQNAANASSQPTSQPAQRGSLTRDALLSMGIRLSLLVCITSSLAYWHLHETLVDETKEQLMHYISERGDNESHVFLLAEANLKRMHEDFTHKVKNLTAQNRAYFDEKWEERPDGTWRSRKGTDFKQEPSLFYSTLVPMTEEKKQLLGMTVHFIKNYGDAYRHQFLDTYITFNDNSLVNYWPGTAWGEDIEPTFDMRKEEYITVASKENNPSRKVAWTGMYYDAVGKTWMVSAEQPVDVDGQWIGSLGHDLTLDEMMTRAVDNHLEGARNMIFRADGRLIVHHDYMQKLQEAGGNLLIKDIGDVEIARIYQSSIAHVEAHDEDTRAGVDEDGVIVDDDKLNSILAVHRLHGPDWFFVVEYPRALITSKAVNGAKFVFGLGLVSLVIEVILLFFVMKRKIAQPLSILTESTEKVAHGDLSVQVHLKRDDELGRLATAFNSMTHAVAERDAQLEKHAASLEDTVAQRTQELDQRNRSMRLVLDTMRQAMMTVDMYGNLSSEKSAAAVAWLGEYPKQNDAGQPVPENLLSWIEQYDPNFTAWFAIGLEQLRDGFMPADVVISQMPQRMRVGERTLSIAYEPIYQVGTNPIENQAENQAENQVENQVENQAENQQLVQVLVVLDDITEKLEYERNEAEQKDLLRVLEAIAKDRRGFSNFIKESDTIVKTLVEQDNVPRNVAARLIHTLKGNCAIFGLNRMAKFCHDVEECLKEQEDTMNTLTEEIRTLMSSQWEQTKEKIQQVLGEQNRNVVEINKQEYERMLQLAAHDDTSKREVYETLASWLLDPVQNRLERLAENAQAVAERLGKAHLQITVDAHHLRTDAETWAPVWSACVHLVRNAVDHGIEHADVRQQKGKSTSGQLRIAAFVEAEQFVVRFADDGAGIDWEKIGKKAKELRLPFMTPEDRVRALLHDGVSSKDDVTDVSGRGVGMGALADEVEKHNGKIHIYSEKDRGTVIELRFPVNEMHRKTPIRALNDDSENASQSNAA